MRVDLRHISDEKKLSYSDVLWQYVKQDFLWRINNAGLGKVQQEKSWRFIMYMAVPVAGQRIMVRRLMYCAISL